MTFGTIPASIVSWRSLLCLWRLTASAPFSAPLHSLGWQSRISYFMGTERFSRAASSDRGKQNGIASNSESLDSFAPTRLCLDHSHRPVLAPATLAALASTLRFPIACVLCRPRPRGSVDALAPARLICYPHRLDRPSRSFPRLGSPKLIRS